MADDRKPETMTLAASISRRVPVLDTIFLSMTCGPSALPCRLSHGATSQSIELCLPCSKFLINLMFLTDDLHDAAIP